MRRRVPLAFALLTFALHLPMLHRYGWFRDELYFLACGRRLAWGYVDQPPLIAVVSRLAWALAGGSLTLYRAPAAIAHAGLVYLAGRFAQRLGGGAALACAAVAFAPLYAVDGHLLTMNAFEPLLYAGVVVLVDRILRGGDGRYWLAVGVLTGVGLLNKHSFAFYTGCLLVAVLLSPQRRALFQTPWLAAAVAIAALIVLPHVIWQVRNGFPMLELLAAQTWKNAPWTLREFVVQQVLELNPIAAVLALLGLPLLWREARFVAIAFALELVLFAALKGKSYYLAAAWVPLFAGADARLRRLRWPAAAMVTVTGAVLLPLAVPILSPAALDRYQRALGVAPPKLENLQYGALPQHLADMFGWQELHDAVVVAAQTIPPGERAAVFTQNYGEAGALELFGSAGLPVISGHNTYWLWGVPAGITAVLIVGGRLEDHLRAFEQCREAARERDAQWAMPYERVRTIWFCDHPRAPLESIWPRTKHYQ